MVQRVLDTKFTLLLLLLLLLLVGQESSSQPHL